MRRLLWFYVFSLLALPLIFAIFTAGASLYLYILYFVDPEFLLYMLAPAVLLWLLHWFFRGSLRSLLMRVNHSQGFVSFRR